MSKKALPQDWKEMQLLHQKEHSREAEKAKTSLTSEQRHTEIDAFGDEVVIKPEPQYRMMRSRAGSRVTRASDDGASHRGLPSSSSDSALSDYLKKGSGLPTIPSPSLGMDTDPIESLTLGRTDFAATVGRARSESRLTRSSRAQSVSGHEQAISLPSDDELNVDGLRQAIEASKQEMARLIKQFDELESATLTRLGGRAVLSRRPSLLLAPPASPVSPYGDEARRVSVSSSSGYSTSAGGLAQSRISIASPPPSIFRRPSKASSIKSSTSAGQQEGYIRPVSILFEEEEDVNVPDNKEILEIRERKESVQRRYKARVDYLEAKLQAQLIKEKLRR